ncbi:MAG: VCBS repeat-containing protein, partial [Minicystis sp.]
MVRSSLFAGLFTLVPALLVLASGCGGGVSSSASSTTASGTTSNTTTTTTGAGGTGGGTGGEGGILITTGNGGSGGQGGTPDPCLSLDCPPDQHCDKAAAACVNNTCADLVCGPTEICDGTPGGGAICKDISCTADVDCPASQHCNGTLCINDICLPGARSCMGAELHECAPNGGSSPLKYICGSQAYFTSACVDDGQGHAGCGCEDDWDCPGFTACEVGVCTGTGKAPTCTLPPEPFASVLPTNEIQWGGTDQANKNAVNAPFPLSSQVSTTPLVINLDDDNGDGLINELDFPEVVFMTYCNTDVSTNGIVRAVHGGGPNKGKDFFATCGATVWHEGDPLNMVCACATATGNSTAVLAAADLDGDGIPEIVVPNETSGLTILDNKGVPITSSANNQWVGYNDPAVTIANLDGAGFAEIVVGRHAFTLQHDAMGKLAFLDHFSGSLMNGSQGQGP